MTINNDKALFKAIGDSFYQIKTTEFGDTPDKAEANTTVTKYPAFYQVPGIIVSKDSTVERTYGFFIGDLVFPDLNNLTEVLSDSEQTLISILKILRQESDDYVLINDPVIIPFKDNWGDDVAGVYAEITIESASNNGYCDIPAVNFGYPGQVPGEPGVPQPSFDCDDLITCPVIETINTTLVDLQEQIDNILTFDCETLENCPSIVIIEETLVDLQEQIDNLPPSALTLAQVLGYGNSTNNISITAGTNLSNILQVSDTVMGLSWNGTVGGNVTLDDTIGTLYHDLLTQIESQGLINILAPTIISQGETTFNSLNNKSKVDIFDTGINLTWQDTALANLYLDNSISLLYHDTLVQLESQVLINILAPTIISQGETTFNSLNNKSKVDIFDTGINLTWQDTAFANLYLDDTIGTLYHDTLVQLESTGDINVAGSGPTSKFNVFSTQTNITSNQINLTSTDNASVNIVSPTGFYYPSLTFYNNGTNLLGQISAYAGTLYFSGSSGTPLLVTSGYLELPLETADTLAYFDNNKRLHSATLGAGLTLVGGVLSASANTTASNGLTKVVNDIKLGGALTANTSITGSFILNIGTTGSKLTEFNTNTSVTNLLSTVNGVNSSFMYTANGVVGLSTDNTSASLDINFTVVGQTISGNGTNNRMIIADNIGSKGLIYSGNYVANFTPESLVSKRYVDTAISTFATRSVTTVATATTTIIALGINNINYSITALASALTIQTSGAGGDFDKLILRIKDNGTARALTFDPTYFEAKGQALPTTTVLGKVITIGFIFDSVTGKMGCVSVSQKI